MLCGVIVSYVSELSVVLARIPFCNVEFDLSFEVDGLCDVTILDIRRRQPPLYIYTPRIIVVGSACCVIVVPLLVSGGSRS